SSSGGPSTQVIATTPPGASAGAVDVSVRNADGPITTVAGAFTYVPPPPTISQVSPAGGPTGGGTTISVFGTGFVAGTTFKLGGATISGTIQSSTLFVGQTASGSGPVDLVATNAGGSATKSPAFFYGPPTFTGMTPTQGALSGGTQVTITGTGFYDGM